jgi:hypothetical protein
MSKLIFAYTPHEIQPPYINISEREDGKIYVTVRSAGARDVSEIEIPLMEALRMQSALLNVLSFGEDD